MKKFLIAFGAGALVLNSWLGSADARPKYNAAFLSTYPNVEAAKTAKCAVCHGTDKKVRNEYGKAVGAALGEPKIEDEAKIVEALKKVEETNAEFAAKLKDGKLPVE
jgi:mono/diheme cytochrome c family protein